LGPVANLRILTAGKRIAQGVPGRLADGLQFLAGLLPFPELVAAQLANELGDSSAVSLFGRPVCSSETRCKKNKRYYQAGRE
jgi:hypothetical protein